MRTLMWIGWLSLKRDRFGLALTFALPIAFFSIFVGIFGGSARSSGGTSQVNVIVVDEDQSNASQRFVNALQKEESLHILTAPPKTPDQLYDRAAANDLVKTGEYPVAVVIPKEFGKTFASFTGDSVPVDLIQDTQRDPVAPQMVMGLMQKAAMMGAPDLMIEQGIGQFEKYAGGLTDQQRAAMDKWLPRLREAMDDANPSKKSNPAASQPESSQSEKSQSEAQFEAQSEKSQAEKTQSEKSQSGKLKDSEKSSNSGFQGLVRVNEVDVHQDEHKTNWEAFVSFQAAQTAVMFLLFSMAGAAGTLLEEQENGTLERLLGSRLGMTGMLAGKWMFIAAIGIAQLSVMFLWAWKPFGLSLWTPQHLGGFAVMTLATAASGSAFGLLLATLARSRGQLSGMSTIIILVMSAVGGSMFPRFMMSDTLQTIGLYTTFNAWALDGYRKVFYDNLPVWQLWPQVLVMALITVVFLIIARLLARRWEAV